ncbi:MFS transporter [Pseudodonghicola xiamenensis]|uniref:MFS transporter n=1 Tax=Pseudodonghicola xiamenensis TaxID=337702 RepID=UPI000481222B
MPRLPVIFLLITVMLDAMGIGLVIPVMPALIVDVEGGTLAQAAVWGGVLSTVFAVMQFLLSPALGNLSDAFGRRPVLLISLCVLTFDYLVMALAGSMWLLLLGRLIAGICSATPATAAAYMADLSPPERKTANFGLIGAAFGAGFVIGPLAGGALGTLGPRAPFYAAAALAALNLIFGLLVMRETVTDTIRRPFCWSRANPLSAFRAVGQLPGLVPLLTVFLLFGVALFVYPAVWAFFAQERFGWGAREIGFSLAAFGITIAVVQGGLIRVALHCLGDRGTVIYGLILNAAGLGLVATITDGRLALLLTPIAGLGAVVMPALQGIMSRIAPDNAQGELQGVLTATNALAMILSPLLMTGAFAAFTGAAAPIYLPSAPFLLAILLLIVAFVVFLRSRFAVT